MSTAQSGLWLGPGLQGVRLGFESQRLLKKSGMVDPGPAAESLQFGKWL